MYRKSILLVIVCITVQFSNAQFLMDMVDTSKETGKGLLALYKKFDHLRIGGYMQPQFQLAQSKGIKTFEGVNFPSNVSNRFMFRRSRVRIDYAHFEPTSAAGVQMVFQFDVNERGFTMRDVWGRLFENKYKKFSFTIGMFARPFGFETNLSSSDRESPERGRMNQTLMKSERDLGAMITFDSRKKESRLKYLKIDAGVFNGQGINASGEFDNSKDVIGRVSLKPYPVSNSITLAAGASILYGGIENNTKYVYTTKNVDGMHKVEIDSSVDNMGKTSPRHYFGADAQIKIKTSNGLITEFRAEMITGKQPGTTINTETPVALLTGFDGFHVRNFRGGYFYFLQNVVSERHQILVKYDFYDPNINTKGKEIGIDGTNFTSADIQFSTLGFGYLNHITDNVKLLVYYAITKNEKTSLPGFEQDLKDNVFTTRLQFRF